MAGMTGGPALAHAEETTTAHDIALASMIAIGEQRAAAGDPVHGGGRAIVRGAGVAGRRGLVVRLHHARDRPSEFALGGVHQRAGWNRDQLPDPSDGALRRGAPPGLQSSAQAVELAVVNTGTGVFASACIMALAFLTPVFTDFRGIAELGIVSAAGLFLCLVSALLIFPALVVLRDRYRPAQRPAAACAADARLDSRSRFSPPGVDRRGRGGDHRRRAVLTGPASASIRTCSSCRPSRPRRSSSRTCCSRIPDARRGSRCRSRPRWKRARRARRPFASCPWSRMSRPSRPTFPMTRRRSSRRCTRSAQCSRRSKWRRCIIVQILATPRGSRASSASWRAG